MDAHVIATMLSQALDIAAGTYSEEGEYADVPDGIEELDVIRTYEEDGSAQSRFDSWRAAWLITRDYPIVGVGVRNANLFSEQYGADMEGRTIHSQYL